MKDTGHESLIAGNLPGTSEAHYRILFEKFPICYQSLNKQARVIDVNVKWLKVTGYKKDEVVSAQLTDFLPTQSKRIFTKAFQQLKTAGSIKDVEFKIRKKDGSLIDISLNGQASFNKKGVFLQSHCVFIDITEKKCALTRLKASEEKYRQIFENHLAPKLIIDPRNGGILDANPAACLFYGYDRKDLLNKTIADINILPNEMSKAKSGLVSDLKPMFFKAFHRLASKEIRQVTVYSTPVKVGVKIFLYAIIFDISEQDRIQDALDQSKAMFRALVECSCDHIFILDPAGVYHFSNDQVDRMGIAGGDELVGKKLSDVYTAELAALYYKMLNLVLETGKPVDFEHSIVVHDNVQHHLDTLYPILKKGKIGMVGGICRDISAIKQTEQAYRRQTRTLEKVNTALNVLIEHLEQQKKDMLHNFSANIEKLVFPYLEKIKIVAQEDDCKTYLEIATTNLNEILAGLNIGSSAQLAKLTPMEMEVAQLVRSGKSGKEIAAMLNVSAKAVYFHSLNIRKKFGLTKTRTSLRAYLKTLT